MEDGVSQTSRNLEPVESVATYLAAIDRGWQATLLALATVAILVLWQVV